MGLAGEELEGFGGLEGGSEVDGGGENAGGVAGFYVAGGGRWEEAGKTGCRGVCGYVASLRSQIQGFFAALRMTAYYAGEDVGGGGVGSYGGGVDPGDGVLDGEVVEEVAGFEVVGAVEDDVGAGDQCCDVGGDEVGDMRGDLDAGVDAGEVAASGFGLGEGFAGVVFVEEDLALEVGGLDEVTVDEGEAADAGAGEETGGGGTGCADSDDGGVGVAEAMLALGADAGEEDLPGVTVEIGYWAGDWSRGRV